MAEASALPLAVITAWEGLVDRAGTREGQRVLVRGGAGGVGHVDRTTPTDDYVASATGGEGFDVIFDAVGGATLDASFAAVRTYTGHVVSILGWGTHSLAPLSFRGATYSGVFTLYDLETVADAHRAVESGKRHGKVVVRVTRG
jgi:NADPH2:quinone reductase